jgi:uncharacterized membrane protein
VPPVGTAVGAIAGVVNGAAGDPVGIADVNIFLYIRLILQYIKIKIVYQ